MLGRMGILGVILLGASLTGCTLPCHPYDECGPVYEGNQGSACSGARAGSILNGQTASPSSSSAPIISEEETEEPSAPLSSYIHRKPNESAPRILSVTDRKVEEKSVISEKQSVHRFMR